MMPVNADEDAAMLHGGRLETLMNGGNSAIIMVIVNGGKGLLYPTQTGEEKNLKKYLTPPLAVCDFKRCTRGSITRFNVSDLMELRNWGGLGAQVKNSQGKSEGREFLSLAGAAATDASLIFYYRN